MTLLLTGDAFPNLLKGVVFKAIERLKLPTSVVSNKRISIGNSKLIPYIIVDEGPDEADNRIVELVMEGDNEVIVGN